MLIFDQLRKSDPRLGLLALVMAAGLVVLLAGLWWVQVVSAREYQASLETQSFRTVRVPAVRGKILDRNGAVLAENVPSYNVGLYFDDLRERFREQYRRLRLGDARRVTNALPFWKRWLGFRAVSVRPVPLQKNEIEALEWQARFDVVSNVIQQVSDRLQSPLPLDFNRFKRHYVTRLALPYTMARNLNPAQLARLEERSADLPGVDLEIEPTRVYPFQTTAAHLLGYLQRDDRSMEGEDAYFSYRLPDYRGALGIERGFDKELHGVAGQETVLVNNLGYRQTESVWTPPEPGENVVLTIDVRLQQAADKALQVFGPTTRGAAVVMNVHTGDILAMVSSPTFNPNDFVSGLTPAEAAWLNDPKLRPEINRATQQNYAPGSVFKPVVALACLQAGLNPDAQIDNPGYIYVGRRHIRDLAPPGEYDLRRAIMFSSNTYFITNGMKAGAAAIVRMGGQFHFGQRIGLPTGQETPGIFPSLKRVNSADWYDGDTANLCIGQGDIAVTPLQMAVMTCALANGGKVLWPRLVERVEPQNPASDEPPIVFPAGRVRNELRVSQRNLRLVCAAMRAEVENGGTGQRAEVPGLEICGKTGTAQVMNTRNQEIDRTTWFISFAPYRDPRWAVVVMVEGGSFGGTTCAPVAKQIYETILKIEQTNAPRNVAAK